MALSWQGELFEVLFSIHLKDHELVVDVITANSAADKEGLNQLKLYLRDVM